MTLPFLPGNSFDKNVSNCKDCVATPSLYYTIGSLFFLIQLGKSKFHKSHFFDYNDDVPVSHGGKKPGIGEALCFNRKRTINMSVQILM